MREETEIAVYAASADNVKYDNAVGNLFMNKEIIAPVLKYVVSEYKDRSIEDIMRYIDADTISVKTPVSDIPIDALDRGTELYSRQMKSAVSIAPAAAAKRYISLCGCVHNFILSGQSFRPPV